MLSIGFVFFLSLRWLLDPCRSSVGRGPAPRTSPCWDRAGFSAFGPRALRFEPVLRGSRRWSVGGGADIVAAPTAASTRPAIAVRQPQDAAAGVGCRTRLGLHHGLHEAAMVAGPTSWPTHHPRWCHPRSADAQPGMCSRTVVCRWRTFSVDGLVDLVALWKTSIVRSATP